MGFVMPEIVVQKLIKFGMEDLKKHPEAFDDIFAQYMQDELCIDYGPAYIELIKKWFFDPKTEIPVLAAWAMNVQRIPCISVHLANESEDESKASLNDIAGTFNDFAETGTAAFTTMIDIGIHALKQGDQVLWLYYIVSYILFRYKPMAHRLGLKLQTYSASDYAKDANKMPNNTWTRWIRFRCTTENFWSTDPFKEIKALSVEPKIDLKPAHDRAATPDVDLCKVDPTANDGITVSSSSEDDDLVI